MEKTLMMTLMLHNLRMIMGENLTAGYFLILVWMSWTIESFHYRNSNVFNPLGSWDSPANGINIRYMPNDFSLTQEVVKK